MENPEPTCQRCGAALEVVDDVIPFPSVIAPRDTRPRRIALPCQACEQRSLKAQEDELRRRQFNTWRFDSGIPKELWDYGLAPATWTKYRLAADANNQEALEAARGWAAAEHSGLYVFGAQGTGKSLLAMCAGLECLRAGQEVLFVSEMSLIDSYRGKREGRDLAMVARSVEVLILDDMGGHQLDRGTAYLMEVYRDIFDSRLPVVGEPMKTMITTQLDPGDAENGLGPWCRNNTIKSRLMALMGGNFVIMQGADRRRARWTISRAGG